MAGRGPACKSRPDVKPPQELVRKSLCERKRSWTSTCPRISSTIWPSSDAFIEAEIKPLQAQDDNERFFDHRREHARTDWDNNGLPRKEWEELLAKARKLADDAGHLRYAWPPEMGGKAAASSPWR